MRESKQDKLQLVPRASSATNQLARSSVFIPTYYRTQCLPWLQVLSRFMATTRLRRAFRYPEDSADEDHEREELDEEGPSAMLSFSIRCS